MATITHPEPAPPVEPGPVAAPRPPARPKGPTRRQRLRRSLHRRFTARRGIFVKAHRWVSLVLVVWIAVEALTGALLVFEPEISQFVRRSEFTSTPGDVGLTRAAEAASEATDGAPVRFISTPAGAGSGGMYWVSVARTDGTQSQVLVDPGSGEVTTTDYEMPQLLQWALRIHIDLNSTSVFGFAGRTVVGALAVAWLVIVITGLYVWYWPGVRRWATALRVRRRRGPFTFRLDLHKAVGIASFIPITLVIITGINFMFPRQVEAVWDVVTFGQHHHEELETPRSAVGTTKPIGAEQARKIVEDLDPAVTATFVSTPGGSPVGVYDVSASVDPSFFHMLGNERDVTFSVDQYSGAIVAIDDHRNETAATEAYESWAYPVHVGTFGGTVTRLLWLLVGLSPIVLGWTGVRMWLDRRKRRNRRRSPETSAPETTAPENAAPETTDEPSATEVPT